MARQPWWAKLLQKVVDTVTEPDPEPLLKPKVKTPSFLDKILRRKPKKVVDNRPPPEKIPDGMRPPPVPEVTGGGGFNFDHGPYRADWSPAARTFWDAEPQTYRDFYTQEEWDLLQGYFHVGWIDHGPHLDYEAHETARQDFYALSGSTADSFDWEAFREYLASIGSI